MVYIETIEIKNKEQKPEMYNIIVSIVSPSPHLTFPSVRYGVASDFAMKMTHFLLP